MCNTEFNMLRSYHFVDPTTVALILRSGIVLFLKLACCLWILFGGGALLIEFLGRRASWFSRAHRIAGHTRLTTHQTGWLLRRILAPMLVALLLLSGAASGNNQVRGRALSSAIPKSKRAALTYSLVWTLVPAAVGGAMMLHGQRISPIGSDRGGGQTDNTEALAGLAIGSAGIILGPGAGHVYAEKTGRFWRGVAIRGMAASITAAISFSASKNSFSIGEGVAQALMALAVGGSICLGSAIYDISTVGTSVDDYNEERGFSSLTLRPTYIAAHKAPGLMLTMSF